MRLMCIACEVLARPLYLSAARSPHIVDIQLFRRGLHNEGSQVLQERLAGKIEVDHDTARRLFTLICALHARDDTLSS